MVVEELEKELKELPRVLRKGSIRVGGWSHESWYWY
jgi:hypothetical protein